MSFLMLSECMVFIDLSPWWTLGALVFRLYSVHPITSSIAHKHDASITRYNYVCVIYSLTGCTIADLVLRYDDKGEPTRSKFMRSCENMGLNVTDNKVGLGTQNHIQKNVP